MHPVDPNATRARKGDPCTVVIFGASGDLTKRKLIPAFYNLAHDKLLPDELAIMAFARREMDTATYRAKMREDVAEYIGKDFDPKVWGWLEERIYYQRGDLGTAADFVQLHGALDEVDKKHKTRGNILFYLATSPDYFA